MPLPVTATAAARFLPFIARASPAIARAAPTISRAMPMVAAIARAPLARQIVRSTVARQLVAQKPYSLASKAITATRLAGSKTFSHLARGNYAAAGKNLKRFVSYKSRQLSRNPVQLASYASRAARMANAYRMEMQRRRDRAFANG